MTTDLAILIGMRYWSAPADTEHPHGHGRIETLVSLFIGLVLAGVGVGLVWRAVVALHEHGAATPGWIAFAAACVSIVVKELLYRWTAHIGRRARSSALAANAWHHRSDALSSVPVAVAVLAARLQPGWGFLDNVAAVVVSVLILAAAWRIIWPAVQQLIDAGASAEQREQILRLALAVEGVAAVHALRTRRIGAGLQVDLHVLVDGELSVREGHSIGGAVRGRIVRDGPDVLDVLVHVEPWEGGRRAGDGEPA